MGSLQQQQYTPQVPIQTSQTLAPDSSHVFVQQAVQPGVKQTQHVAATGQGMPVPQGQVPQAIISPQGPGQTITAAPPSSVVGGVGPAQVGTPGKSDLTQGQIVVAASKVAAGGGQHPGLLPVGQVVNVNSMNAQGVISNSAQNVVVQGTQATLQQLPNPAVAQVKEMVVQGSVSNSNVLPTQTQVSF